MEGEMKIGYVDFLLDDNIGRFYLFHYSQLGIYEVFELSY